jgi:sugar phosphate isomerase/epimerase
VSERYPTAKMERTLGSTMKIAAQVWSLRKSIKADLAGTVKAAKQAGFDGLEFYGDNLATPAAELKRVCDDAGIEVAGYHVPFDTLLGKSLAENVDYHQALGNTRLICPMFPAAERGSAAAWSSLGKRFAELATKLAPYGLSTGFHNHRVEFEPIEGKLPWELFFDAASPDVIMQLDIGNALPTGVDTMQYFDRYPKRARSIHIKDWSADGPVLTGQGKAPVLEAVRRSKAQGVTEWYVIEQDYDGMPEIECLAQCLGRFREIAAQA